jgi:hypothetical protein
MWSVPPHSVNKRVSRRIQAMCACMTEIGGGFFEGCAHPAMQPPIPTTYPHPQRKSTGTMAIGFRPEEDHYPRYQPQAQRVPGSVAGSLACACTSAPTNQASVSALVSSTNAESNVLPPAIWRCSHCGSGKLFVPHFVLFDPKVAKKLYCYTYLRYE